VQRSKKGADTGTSAAKGAQTQAQVQAEKYSAVQRSD